MAGAAPPLPGMTLGALSKAAAAAVSAMGGAPATAAGSSSGNALTRIGPDSAHSTQGWRWEDGAGCFRPDRNVLARLGGADR
jgi:hypothetical protein